MKQLFVLLLTVTAFSLACDDAKPSTSSRPSLTSPSFVVTGSLVRPSVSALANGCPLTGTALADLQLIVAASNTDVFVDDVIVRLGDGSNLGGPMVTFPRPALDSRFGNTMVRAGATRAFGFPSAFTCATGRGLLAQALVTLIDMSGARSLSTTPVAVR